RDNGRHQIAFVDGLLVKGYPCRTVSRGDETVYAEMRLAPEFSPDASIDKQKIRLVRRYLEVVARVLARIELKVNRVQAAEGDPLHGPISTLLEYQPLRAKIFLHSEFFLSENTCEK